MFPFLAKKILSDAGYSSPGFDLLYKGQKCFCISPHSEPRHILKIPLSVLGGYSFKDEIAILEKLADLDRDAKHFVIPKLAGRGTKLSYFIMTRLGPTYEARWHLHQAPLEADIPRLAEGVAEFSARLFLNHGLVHRDIYWRNLTHYSDDKIGVIDFEEIVRGEPNDIFAKPLLYKPNIVPLAIERFIYHAQQISPERKIEIDPGQIISNARTILANSGSDDAKNLEAVLESNIAEWVPERRMPRNLELPFGYTS